MYISLKGITITLLSFALAYGVGSWYWNEQRNQKVLQRLDYAAMDERSIPRQLVEIGAIGCAKCAATQDFCVDVCACLYNSEVSVSHSKADYMVFQAIASNKPETTAEQKKLLGDIAVECAAKYNARGNTVP